MQNVIPIEFQYRHKTYYALIRKRCLEGANRYHVTVMDSTLDHLLSGNDIFVIEKGKCHPATLSYDSSVKELVSSIVSGIRAVPVE